MPSSHHILCHPILLLPPIPPSIRVFSSESTLRMRWPKPLIIPALSLLSLYVSYSTKNRSNPKRISLQVHTIMSVHLKASVSLSFLPFCSCGSTIGVLFLVSPYMSSAFCTLKDIVHMLSLLSPTSSVFSSKWIISMNINILSNQILTMKKIFLILNLPPAKASHAHFNWQEDFSEYSLYLLSTIPLHLF